MTKDQKGDSAIDKAQKEEKEEVEDSRNQPRDWAEDARRDLERRADRGSKKVAKHREKEREKEMRSFGIWQKERKTVREAKEYSDLRISYDSGSLPARAVTEYLRDFPSNTEYQAFVKIAEMAERGELQGIGMRKLQEKIEEDIVRSGHRGVGKEEKEQREKIKMLMEAVRERVGRSGPPKSKETKEKFFSAAEWEEAILREYSAGRISEDDLRAFTDYYTKEKKSAYKRLAEEEGIKLRETEEIDWDEIGDRILIDMGLREELVKDIPTKDGKTIFEEMLDEQIDAFKQFLRATISHEEHEKKIAEFSGDKEKAERELVAEAAKKFLAVRELFTHGVLGYDKEKGQIVLDRYSDLDGKCAIALFGKAGIDISRTEYLKPEEYRKGQITVDSGNKDGLVQESVETVDPETGERKVEITTFFDHHGPYSGKDTSATKTVYKVLTELGLLEFKDDKEKGNYDKVVRWVTRFDNFNFPGIGKYFDTSDRRMIGFLKFSNLERLLKFAASGKELTDILSEQDLRQFGINFKDRKTGKFIDRAKERREVIDEAKRKARELASRGFLISAKDGKKFLIDTTGEAGGEFQWAAASLGYDGIIRYNQDTQGFFVALNEGEIDSTIFKGLPQGRLVRKSMFLQPQGQEKLVVGLGDLLNRLSPGFEPGRETGLKRFLEKEPWRIRSIISRAPEGYWWTNTPSGKKVIVRGLPESFKSGDEAYLLLEEPRNVREDEKRKYGGDFLIGYWESDKIILPKKPEVKKAPAKMEVRKEQPAKPTKVEIKKPAAPEVKVAAKPEVRLPAPKVEKERTPEEVKKIEGEITKGKEYLWKKVFEKTMQTLKDSPVWGKRSEKEREEVARNAADLQAKSFEQTERKKYGI